MRGLLTFVAAYEIEFYEDAHGDAPVLRWLREELSPRKRRALGTAMNRVLQELGVGVCNTKFGRQLGQGLFEFRLRGSDLAEVVTGARDPGEAKMLLRVFCHAHGDKLILLLAGYDKGEASSAKRQSQEIAVARSRLKDWQKRHRGGAG
ncbi:MAG: hypothetical protein QM704_08390 [Anaeromyxobacteraceae bacterium]